MDSSYQRYYTVLQARKMRWINCDQFINDPSNVIMDYLVTVSTPGVRVMNVFLIYPKINSVIQLGEKDGGYQLYARVPMSQQPQLLITGMKKDQLMIFFENIIPQNQKKKEVELRESNFNELERIMKKL